MRRPRTRRLSLPLAAGEALPDADLKLISSGIECPARIALQLEGGALGIALPVARSPQVEQACDYRDGGQLVRFA